MDVNLYGIVETSRIFLPLVRKEKGRIVCVTSVMGRLAAIAPPYVVSKYAAEGYCDLLRRDVKNCGVTVHILEPGSFATNLSSKESITRSITKTFSNADEDVRKFYGEEYRDTSMMLEVFCIIVVLYLTVQYYRRSIMLENYKGRHVMITGCDTGFGNMLAKRLDSMGFIVFAGCLTDKGGEDLKAAVSERLHVVSLDVTKAESIENAFQTVKASLPPKTGLWGLVNNAGVAGGVGHIEWLKLKDYKFVMDINLYGIIEMSRIFLPLVRIEKGRIVCITSMMGRIAAASPPYVASKFAAEGFCDSLRRAVKNFGITVHILEPGFFATNITNKEILKKNVSQTFADADEDVREFYGEEYRDKMIELVDKTLEKTCSKDTYKVVDAYVHALCAKYPKCRYVVGTDANTIFRFLWTVPEWISDYILTFQFPSPAGMQS